MENITIDAIRQNFWLSMVFATVLTSLFWYVLNKFSFFERTKNIYIIMPLTALATLLLTDFQYLQKLVDLQNIGFKVLITFSISLTVAENSGIAIVKRMIVFVSNLITSFFNRIRNIFIGNEKKEQQSQ